MKYLYLFFLLSFITPSINKSYAQVQFSSSNLPLVFINTNGQTIRDSPKIYGNMGIVWNDAGKRNSINDIHNNYNGKIAIEIRGSSSQMFPKKSYGFETINNDLSNNNVSLIGMPQENDWILYAPYTDKTMIRDALSYILAASFMEYSPRCRYVELFLNNSYQGVYVLMEKIKRDKNRVDIAKLILTDVSGEDLTGGYIIKIDKTTGGTGEGWSSNYPNAVGKSFYQYHYPKSTDINIFQKNYIQDYVRQMENSFYFEVFSGIGNYNEFIEVSTFIDFMIVNELAKNVDGYRLSSYLFKPKNGKMKCGPIWDFNLTYGNADYYNGWSTVGFQYQANLGNDGWQNPFWWNKLIKDANYSNALKKRYSILRKKELSDIRINFVVDSLTNLINEAKERNYAKWPIIGVKVWPNYYVGPSYDSEVNWMKTWIKNRLVYLDQMWPYNFTNISPEINAPVNKVFPNPFNNYINVQLNNNSPELFEVELIDMKGQKVVGEFIHSRNGQLILDGQKINKLNSGVYLLRVLQKNEVVFTSKIIKSN